MITHREQFINKLSKQIGCRRFEQCILGQKSWKHILRVRVNTKVLKICVQTEKDQGTTLQLSLVVTVLVFRKPLIIRRNPLEQHQQLCVKIIFLYPCLTLTTWEVLLQYTSAFWETSLFAFLLWVLLFWPPTKCLQDVHSYQPPNKLPLFWSFFLLLGVANLPNTCIFYQNFTCGWC